MRKLAIIGASYLQEPLIRKAKDMGIETHVFAWAADDVGEKIADYFYPISIVEKDEILHECRKIGIDGICTIASDLAAVTVNYVANAMGLIGNSPECAITSTNKREMRKAFEKNGDPSPKSVFIGCIEDIEKLNMKYPIIVKPLDRSGSRGIRKIEEHDYCVLKNAVKVASEQGFVKGALVEEFLEGKEYSVEYVSFKGEHYFLAITEKYTTGAPDFIETGHVEPAGVSDEMLKKVQIVVEHALDTLGVTYGASHSELKIDDNGNIGIVEIGARMGGDFIGSDLVMQSTGVDFVQAVIDIALGKKPDLAAKISPSPVGVRFIMCNDDIVVFNHLQNAHPEWIIASEVPDSVVKKATDSSSRSGYFLFKAPTEEDVRIWME